MTFTVRHGKIHHAIESNMANVASFKLAQECFQKSSVQLGRHLKTCVLFGHTDMDQHRRYSHTRDLMETEYALW